MQITHGGTQQSRWPMIWQASILYLLEHLTCSHAFFCGIMFSDLSYCTKSLSIMSICTVLFWTLSWIVIIKGQNPNYKPSNLLPDILTFINGTKVQTLSDWSMRRNELKQLLDYYILGTKPPFPNILTFHQINSTTLNQATSTYFYFTVDIAQSSPIIIELLCPLKKYLQNGQTFSLIVSQYNHREWLQRGVQRKIFCGLRTPTADVYDLSQQFKYLYDDTYTWGKIARRAWLNSIILNFLIDYNITNNTINFAQIGITGHSRNGKQSLITAAYDERITAVIGSSAGMPISAPFRYAARDYFGETVLSDTYGNRDWWCNNIQQFYGKENECPADGHFITALIAPRHVMFANAMNDNDGDNPFATDQNYLANHAIFYHFPYQSREGALTVQHRHGAHHGFIQIETYIDYFQFALNRTGKSAQFKSPVLMYDFDWSVWNESFYEYMNHTIPNRNESIRHRIAWLIGSDAVEICGGASSGSTYTDEQTYIVDMMGEVLTGHGDDNVTQVSFGYGGYAPASIYYLTNRSNDTLTPIIYLHPYSYAPGYVPNYVSGQPFYYFFAQQGYAVIALHQIGFGERQYEGTYFYDRFGMDQQSRFGHMVMNVRALIDAIECHSNEAPKHAQCATYSGLELSDNKMPNMNMNELSVVGYAMGGQIAIHAAALDLRIQNIASIAGFTPLRTNTNDLGNAGK
eukprot:1029559_1